MISVEQKLSEALESNKALTAKVTELTESINATKKEATKKDLEGQIKEAKLSEAAAKVVLGQFDKGLLPTPELVKEAITAFKEATPIVKRNNGGQVQESAQVTEAERVKAYQRKMRCSEKEARKFLGLD
jgi:hypothetical protein